MHCAHFKIIPVGAGVHGFPLLPAAVYQLTAPTFANRDTLSAGPLADHVWQRRFQRRDEIWARKSGVEAHVFGWWWPRAQSKNFNQPPDSAGVGTAPRPVERREWRRRTSTNVKNLVKIQQVKWKAPKQSSIQEL